MTGSDHRVRGVDHIAYPTFDPAATVTFYRDVLGFPVVHSICAAGWGPEKHGVDGAFAATTAPVSSDRTASVNVPPTSTPIT